MAKIYSDIQQADRTFPRDQVNVGRKGGRVRVLTAQLVLAATVAAGDKGVIAKLPSNARILPESTIYFSGGLTGLDEVNLGAAGAEDALVNGDDWSGGAGNVGALDAKAPTDYGKALWELLGLSADPHSEIELYLTFVAELTGAGTCTADLRYVID